MSWQESEGFVPLQIASSQRRVVVQVAFCRVGLAQAPGSKADEPIPKWTFDDKGDLAPQGFTHFTGEPFRFLVGQMEAAQSAPEQVHALLSRN
ncbi:MAG TPA: hypothetical protein VGM62_14690 [Chthoniobacterales bacterium]